jgi:hypothetical protein
MTKTLSVHVAKEHIRLGKPKCPTQCMIVMAIKDAIPDASYVSVTTNGIRITKKRKSGGSVREYWTTPTNAARSLIAFDQGQPVKPFTATMKFVEEKVIPAVKMEKARKDAANTGQGVPDLPPKENRSGSTTGVNASWVWHERTGTPHHNSWRRLRHLRRPSSYGWQRHGRLSGLQRVERAKAGEAELAQADQNKQIAIAQAKAKADSAKFEAEAEITRAGGVAQANKIIGDSLKDNEAYLRYLWINGLEQNKNQTVVYVPTEANLPILEAGRMKKP